MNDLGSREKPNLDRVLKCLYAAADEVNEIFPAGQKMEKTPDTPLYGPESGVDSVNLVQFLVIAEQKLRDDFGVLVSLANDSAFSRRNSPFRSMESLAEFAAELLGAR